MFTWNTYLVETLRREDQIADAMQDRFIQTVTKDSEPRLARISIRMLDLLGSKLVEWGKQMQCRGAELTMTISKRAA
jgi:hypothetical protein